MSSAVLFARSHVALCDDRADVLERAATFYLRWALQMGDDLLQKS